MMQFTLFIEPQAQQRPRFSKWGTHKSKTQAAHDAEMDCQLMCHVPDSPLCGPVSVDFTAFIPIPRSTPKRDAERLRSTETPHAKRKDIDNLAKQLLDRMTALKFWRDDGQVWRLTGKKVYSDLPRWEVTVTEYDENGL